MVEDQVYMERALELAQMAAAIWEVPVGAVVVCDGQIVGEGYNRRESGKNALAHAELEAIDMACRRLGGWRLHRCDLYVTLEPCPMCAGAIVNARIRRVVYGASTPKRVALVRSAISMPCRSTINQRSFPACFKTSARASCPLFSKNCGTVSKIPVNSIDVTRRPSSNLPAGPSRLQCYKRECGRSGESCVCCHTMKKETVLVEHNLFPIF